MKRESTSIRVFRSLVYTGAQPGTETEDLERTVMANVMCMIGVVVMSVFGKVTLLRRDFLNASVVFGGAVCMPALMAIHHRTGNYRLGILLDSRRVQLGRRASLDGAVSTTTIGVGPTIAAFDLALHNCRY